MLDVSVFKQQLLNTLIFVSDGESDLIAKMQALTGKEAWFVALFADDDLLNNSFSKSDKEKLFKSYESILSLLDDIKDNKILEFSEEELHKAIKSEADLAVPANKERILAICYRLLGNNDSGLVATLADVLEKMDNKKMFFSSLNTKDRSLYFKIYIVAVALNFGAQKLSTQRAFLANSFVVLALRMGFDISQSVGQCVRANLTVINRRNLSIDLSASLGINQGRTGTDKNSNPLTVAEWIEKAKLYVGENLEIKKLQNFYLTDKDFLSNVDFERILIKQIVDLYFKLVNGEFIFEDDVIKKTVEKIRDDKKNREMASNETGQDLSFDKDLQAHRKDFAVWIKQQDTLSALLDWLKSFEDKKLAIEKLTVLLKFNFSKIGDNLENVFGVVFLNKFIQQNGYNEKEDLVYFNEQTGQFDWI